MILFIIYLQQLLCKNKFEKFYTDNFYRYKLQK